MFLLLIFRYKVEIDRGKMKPHFSFTLEIGMLRAMAASLLNPG